MSKAVALLLALFASPCVMPAQPQPSSSAPTELIRIEQALARAWVDHDRAFLEKTLASDWSVTDASGHVLSRAAVLTEGFETSNRVIDSAQIDGLEVRLYGSTAVVTGRTIATGKLNGVSMTTRLRFTDVFVATPGGWQVVASHASEIRE